MSEKENVKKEKKEKKVKEIKENKKETKKSTEKKKKIDKQKLFTKIIAAVLVAFMLLPVVISVIGYIINL